MSLRDSFLRVSATRGAILRHANTEGKKERVSQVVFAQQYT